MTLREVFGPAVARDVLDGLRLLEGRCAGTNRRLAPGTLELRAFYAEVAGSRGSTTGHSGRKRVHADAFVDDEVVPALLTFDDVAAALRTSHSSVKRLVREGALPVVHLGRSVRIRPVDLAGYVEALPVERRPTITPEGDTTP